MRRVMRWVVRGLLLAAACFAGLVVVAGVWEHAQRPKRIARLRCYNQLMQVGVFLDMYATEHSGTYPAAIEEAVSPPILLRCTGEKAWPHLRSLGAGGEYVYVGAGLRKDAFVDPSETPLLFCRTAVHIHHTRNVLMASYEVVLMDEAQFQSSIAAALAREDYGEEAVQRMRQIMGGEASRVH